MSASLSDILTIYSPLLLAATVLLSLTVLWFYRQQAELKRENEDLRQKLKKVVQDIPSSQLDNLEARLNPHLFKNILNSIQSHAYQTWHSMDRLSHVLDYILYESRKSQVSPKEEVEFALALIEINKIKVSPLFELKIKTRCDENDPGWKTPSLAPMLAVDLIENAFKHADLQSPDAFINILVEWQNGEFNLVVSNKISAKTPLKKESSGIGSKTLEQRLELLYPGRYQLHRTVENEVYLAQLKISLVS